jgi:hypothetical protein
MYSYFHQLRSSATFQRIIFIIVPLMHLTGFIGLQLSATQSLFKALVPFHLLSSVDFIAYFSSQTGIAPPYFFALIAYFTLVFLLKHWGYIQA